MQLPFSPGAATVSLAVTTTSGRVAITGAPSPSTRLHNAGPATVFVKAGDATVTAATTDMPIPSGQTEVFDLGAATNIAAITSASTATLYATAGAGT